MATSPWARPEGAHQRSPMPAEYSAGITAGSRPGGVPSPTRGDVSTRPATPAAGSKAAEGRSVGPRSALDAAGEWRGSRRLAATTAGPRTGAGSRPRRRRRGRSHPVSCPGEAGQRTASADRVVASARVAAAWCCRWCWRVGCAGLSSVCWWCCCWFLLVVLGAGPADGCRPVSFPLSARRFALGEASAVAGRRG